MEAAQVIEEIRGKGFLITPTALQEIIGAENPEELAKNALKNARGILIDVADLGRREKTKIKAEPAVIIKKTSFRPAAKEIDAQVSVLQDIDSRDSLSTGALEDFIDYFKSRCRQMTPFLKIRGENLFINIKDLGKRREVAVKIIGLINEKKTTKNGHILLDIEDMTGSTKALIPKSNERLIRFAGGLLLDEVVALEGKKHGDLFIVNSVYEPDVMNKEVKTIEEDISLITLSDMHIGHRLFMRDNFEEMLAWLKGERGDIELAGKVKYITIAGDVCDGVGVYPKQEDELEITDVYKQYEELTKYILEIPEYIQVIISPGNHDAVKHADPQPRLPEKLIPELAAMKNINFISSPGMVELHGLKTLIYHGTSFADFISAIPGLSYESGAKVMIEMLKKRHVHPVYGGKPITPEKEDQLFIKEIPDIFHTGESHNNSYDIYKGTVCINSGTWQDITEYIISKGYRATPCILPILDLKRGKISAMHFGG